MARDREIGVSLSTPRTVQKLQTALHAKAKGSPNFRFYSLYDKVCRMDVLSHAYACCRANKGSAGVDGQAFEDIEQYGLERWVGELAEVGRSARRIGPWTPTWRRGSAGGCVRSTRCRAAGIHDTPTGT